MKKLKYIIIITLTVLSMAFTVNLRVGLGVNYLSPSDYFTEKVNSYNDNLFTDLDNPVIGETQDGEKIHPFHMVGFNVDLVWDIKFLRILSGVSLSSSFTKTGFYEVNNSTSIVRTEQEYSSMMMMIPLDFTIKVKSSENINFYFGGGPLFVFSKFQDNLTVTRDTVQQLDKSYEYLYEGGNVAFELIFGSEKKFKKNSNLSVGTSVKYRSSSILSGFTGKKRLDDTVDTVMYEPMDLSGLSVQISLFYRLFNKNK